MIKIKIGDTVKVVLGKDKGKEGSVEKVNSNQSVIIAGINLYKKHVKPALTADGKGGVFEIPRPLNVAKVALVCPNCKKITRVGFKVEADKKIRICRKCAKTIDGVKPKKESKKK